jgi:hypothetical protein
LFDSVKKCSNRLKLNLFNLPKENGSIEKKLSKTLLVGCIPINFTQCGIEWKMEQNHFFRFLLLGVLFLIPFGAFSQTELESFKKPKIELSGFFDLFYVYDFNTPEGDIRQPFLYNHNRHNQLNFNLVTAKASLSHSRYRANLGLHAGTYVKDNYINEPREVKIFPEANVGVALNSKGTLWVDVGIFGSHIGFESAVSMDNLTLTRSILAENSPYFEAGGKLTFNPNEKWEVAGLVLTGWQRIKPVNGNSLPSFGTQLKFFPGEKTTLNWSTFLGTDDPDTDRRMRYFNNLFGQFQLASKIILITGFDFGLQQENQGSNSFDSWLSPVLIAQYSFHQNWKAAFRTEYYQDPRGVIIPVEAPEGFRTSGISLNLDYSPLPNSAIRVEARWLKSQDKVLGTPENLSDEDFFLGTSLAMKFPMKK